MKHRRLARLILAAALAAGSASGLAACNNGSKAGDGVTSPPSSSGK